MIQNPQQDPGALVDKMIEEGASDEEIEKALAGFAAPHMQPIERGRAALSKAETIGARPEPWYMPAKMADVGNWLAGFEPTKPGTTLASGRILGGPPEKPYESEYGPADLITAILAALLSKLGRTVPAPNAVPTIAAGQNARALTPRPPIPPPTTSFRLPPSRGLVEEGLPELFARPFSLPQRGNFIPAKPIEPAPTRIAAIPPQLGETSGIPMRPRSYPPTTVSPPTILTPQEVSKRRIELMRLLGGIH